MGVIRMRMRATCHQEVCATCYQGEGSLQLALAWTIEENDGYASSRYNRSLHYDLDRGTYSRDPCTYGSKTEGNPHLKNGCQGMLLS